jgi:ABC-2 type transport system permease protein
VSTGDVGLVGRQLVAEQKSFWRNPLSAGFTFAFPIMFLLLFSVINGDARLPEMGNILFTELYTSGIITFGIISACFTNLALTLTRLRDEGTLKRKRATPLPAWVLLAGMMANAVLTALIIAALTVAIGIVGFHNSLPRNPLLAVAIIALGSVTFCALGVAVTAMVPNADAAPAIVNVMIFPLLFLSGTFFPIGNETINDVVDLLPIRPFRELLFTAFDPGGVAGPLRIRYLVVLALWGIAGAVVAVRTFRWERRGA